MSFGDYDFTLAANTSTPIEVTGSIVRVRSCTGKLQIKIDGGPGANFNAGQGFKMPPGQTFRTLTVRDMSGAGNTGVIFIGDASYEDSTFNGAVTITGGLPALQGAYTQTTPAVTNADSQLLAANAARRYAFIQNCDALANVYIRLDGAVATVVNGIRIPPGGYYELQAFVASGAIHIIADQATADVRVLEA